MERITRRHLLTQTGVAALAALPVGAEVPQRSERPMRILVAGGHPGDPEAGCGGTIARYTQAGHEVTCLYLTRGEAGVRGKLARAAAAMRSAEAEKACTILKAKPVFADQIDGATEITPARYADFNKLIAAANPDVVFTQWPLDTHRDHRVCGMLTLDAWMSTGRKFALYYYEVDLGSDTLCFRPTHYVDVTATEPLKREACMAHASQDPAGFYTRDFVPMLQFRGMERGVKQAEAFIHHDPSPAGFLPE